jgi:ABC-type multidrug transport system ATPase subunit
MIHKPALLIFDEPFNTLDLIFLEKFAKKIKILSASGISFLITTHIDVSKYFEDVEIETFIISESKITQQF